MSRISVKKVTEFADEIRWDRVAKKIVHAAKGERLFPSKTPKNDRQYNFRADKGAKVGDKYEVILQANKNASDPGVRAEAAKNSHFEWAKILIDPEKDIDEQKPSEAMVESFREK